MSATTNRLTLNQKLVLVDVCAAESRGYWPTLREFLTLRTLARKGFVERRNGVYRPTAKGRAWFGSDVPAEEDAA